jgi:hypothetical protein
MALHNINAVRGQRGEGRIDEVAELRDEIGIGVDHEDYEILIERAEVMLGKYGETTDSANVAL